MKTLITHNSAKLGSETLTKSRNIDLRRLMKDKSIVSDPIWPNFEVIQDFVKIHKYEKDQIEIRLCLVHKRSVNTYAQQLRT